MSSLQDSAWERNPRTIDRESQVGLRRSMADFGDISGIVVNLRNGKLVAGHQRIRQLLDKYGDVDPEIVRVSEDRGLISVDGQSWSVRFVDWDEETHAKANIAANNPKIQGEFDQLTLGSLLEDLSGDESFHALRFDAMVEDMPQLVDGSAVGEFSGADGQLIGEMECGPYEHYDYVLVVTKTAQQWNRLLELLDIPEVATGEAGARRIGLGRAIFAEKLLAKLEPTS